MINQRNVEIAKWLIASEIDYRRASTQFGPAALETINGLPPYATLVFDCDGVILNSNRVKTEAFRQAALPYGEAAAEALVDYHVAHGGVSRYRKFAHFLTEIVSSGQVGPDLDELLDAFAAAVRRGLLTCDVAQGLAELRKITACGRWLVVSGGDQQELRDVFAQRDLIGLFDGGIFGSPDSKEEILAREIGSGNIQKPAVFFGDSRYDHVASSRAGLDFIFVSGWTEMPRWQAYVRDHGIQMVRSLVDVDRSQPMAQLP